MPDAEVIRLLITHKQDWLGMVALGVLMKCGGRIKTIDGDQPAPHDSVIVFTTIGNPPNRFVRLIDLKDEDAVKRNAERRQIIVPDWGRYATFAIAIPSRITQMMAAAGPTPAGFIAALEHAHTALHPSTRPHRKVVKTRDQWESGHHARIRERQRNRESGHFTSPYVRGPMMHSSSD